VLEVLLLLLVLLVLLVLLLLLLLRVAVVVQVILLYWLVLRIHVLVFGGVPTTRAGRTIMAMSLFSTTVSIRYS
jgi:hypothetical protein